MSQSNPKLPSPSLLGLAAAFSALVGVLALRVRGNDENTLLTLIEGLGLICGLGLGIFAILVHVAPEQVRRFLEEMGKPQDPKTPPAPAVVSRPQAPESGGMDFLGPWTGIVVFGVASMLLSLASFGMLDRRHFQVFAFVVSLLPVCFGAAAAYLHGENAHDDSAKWLTKATLATVAAVCIVAVLVFAEGQLKEVHGGFKQLFG